jgi:hypothetical protein
MKRIRIAIGVALIMGGLILGAWITLHYFSEGIGAIRSGQFARGIILLVVWSELLGIASMLALVFPGVFVLKNAGDTRQSFGELAQQSRADSPC